MRKRRAIIHIGTAKTGSTSIQRMLEANRPLLAQHGYCYPTSPGDKNHFRLAIYAGDSGRTDKMARVTGEAGDASWVAKRFEADLAREMEDLPDSVHTVIFSNEHCYRKISTPEAAKRLKALLDQHFDEYQVIAYLRRQDELAVSLYSTRMRSGSDRTEVLPPLEENRKNAHRFDWHAMCERWAAAFGRDQVKPRLFGRAEFVGGELLKDFQHACGMGDILDLSVVGQVNSSISAAAQEFLRRINAASRPAGAEEDEGDEKVPEFIRHVVDAKFSGTGRRPSRAEAETFYEAFREANERLRADYFPGRERVFSEDFSRYPATPDPVPSEGEVLEVALAVVLEQAAQVPSKVAENAYKRGTDKLRAGETQEARRFFNKALGKEPAHIGALTALFEIGEDDPEVREEAEARLRRALAADGKDKALRKLAAEHGVDAERPARPKKDRPAKEKGERPEKRAEGKEERRQQGDKPKLTPEERAARQARKQERLERRGKQAA